MCKNYIELLFSQKKPYSLQSYLKEVVHIPKGLLHELRMSNKVRVNGTLPNWTHMLENGDTISLPILSEEISIAATKMDVSIIFEDEHMLMVNKEAGIDTHPASHEDHQSLSNGVAHYFRNHAIHAKVRHIHRLDKDTSGALLFAKHALSGALLDRALEERKIKRTYIALVEGLVTSPSGSIDRPIGKDRHHASRRRISPNGQKAITHFKVIKKFPNEKLTLVQVNLDTGRTHQIRVHMSSLGHPLVGDALYGANGGQTSRQSLHALKLTVPHPFTQKVVEVTAPIPADFAPALLYTKIMDVIRKT